MNRKFITLEQLKSVASALLAKINQKPDSSSLSDVSFTGDYNDLSNRPDFSNFVNQSDFQTAANNIYSDYMMIGRDYVTAGQKSGTTLGDLATAEGNQTTASGSYAHAEGDNTTASGPFSHAEGTLTVASGSISHAEGSNTIANHALQHVFGTYNIADTNASAANYRGTYVEIVGNGTSSARSNARTLDWNGNETLAGTLTIGGANGWTMSVDSSGNMTLLPASN